MAAPREISKGTTSLITRRTNQRQLLTIPTDENNQILLYCMIHAANLYDIQIHAYFFASNHYHLCITDPLGKVPDFEAWLNRFSAKCLNSKHGRWGNLWDTGSYSAVRLREEFPDLPDEDSASEDILDKIVYTLTNPVAAGLVDRGYKWPGLWSSPSQMVSGHIEARRPVFFSEEGDLPERVRMKLTIPPGFNHMTPKQFSNLVRGRVREKEEEIRQDFKDRGRTFMGAEKVKAQKRESKSRSWESRRKLNPRIACKDKKKRIELLERLKKFLKEYREAYKKFSKGERDVLFPPGTYKMRKFFNVKLRPRLSTEPIPI